MIGRAKIPGAFAWVLLVWLGAAQAEDRVRAGNASVEPPTLISLGSGSRRTRQPTRSRRTIVPSTWVTFQTSSLIPGRPGEATRTMPRGVRGSVVVRTGYGMADCSTVRELVNQLVGFDVTKRTRSDSLGIEDVGKCKRVHESSKHTDAVSGHTLNRFIGKLCATGIVTTTDHDDDFATDLFCFSHFTCDPLCTFCVKTACLFALELFT